MNTSKPKTAECLVFPDGLIAMTVLPAHLPIVCAEQAGFPDIWEGGIQEGDVLFISPDSEGRYILERDGLLVIVGTLHGYYQY